MTPIYLPENCQAAFQLNWTVTVFGNQELPPKATWYEPLKAALEPDGVRILEARLAQPHLAQFFVSTQQAITPSEIVRFIKARWQYLLRSQQPSAFQRNYFIGSVGKANSEALDHYVARQIEKHPMADDRVTARLAELQFHNPKVALDEEQRSSHGRFVHSLQVVVECVAGWNEIRDEVQTASRNMIVRASNAKGWRLARTGLLSNHIHILLGCGVTESPESVALSLLNNLAFVQGMKPVYRFSYYVGTFGKYDRNAIRRRLIGDGK
jgi:REP element-mobilizing transposase RayT